MRLSTPPDSPQFCSLARVDEGFCSARVAAFLPAYLRPFWCLLLLAMQFCPAPSPAQQLTFSRLTGPSALLSAFCFLFSVLGACAPATAGIQLPGDDTGRLPVGVAHACQSLSLCHAMQFCQRSGIEFPFGCRNAVLAHIPLQSARVHGHGPQHASSSSTTWSPALSLQPSRAQCLSLKRPEGCALSPRSLAMLEAVPVGRRLGARCMILDLH